MGRKSSSQTTLVAIVMFIAMLVGCQKSPTQKDAPINKPLPLQKIIVACTAQPQSALIHIAVAKGYFVEEGLMVETQLFNYGKSALQSVLDNKADFATVAETPIMFSVLNGAKITVIANMTNSSTDTAILARKDAAISTPVELKGKRIGFTPGTTNEFFLDSLLTANGITMKDIIEVPMMPEQMKAAILDKKVDAIST